MSSPSSKCNHRLCYNSGMRQAVVFIALLFPALAHAQQQPSPQASEEIVVFFSPNGGCTDAVVRELAQAKSTIYVQAYSFTSAPIAKALLDAKKRGVDVEVILDKSNKTAKYSSADLVEHAGIPTSIDASHAIAHNKIMVIDKQTVVTGSFNFTTAAERHNAENLLIIHNPAIAETYLKNWQHHHDHSKTYAR